VSQATFADEHEVPRSIMVRVSAMAFLWQVNSGLTAAAPDGGRAADKYFERP
jgi:hypothetical protein